MNNQESTESSEIHTKHAEQSSDSEKGEKGIDGESIKNNTEGSTKEIKDGHRRETNRSEGKNTTKNDEKRTFTTYIGKFRSIIATFINWIIPQFAPVIDLDEKLIPDEEPVDHAIVRYFLEIQILIGIIGTIAGIFLIFEHIYFIFLLIASLLLFLTGFELEEIYVTTKRLIIRRIGVFERIIRIPSDEEHLIEHLVSYRIGRAPFNLPLIGVSLLSLFALFSSLPPISEFFLFLSGVIIFIFALRLGRRNITMEFAGGHQVLLGIRKGIPYHIIKSLMKVVYGSEEVDVIDKDPKMISEELAKELQYQRSDAE